MECEILISEAACYAKPVEELTPLPEDELLHVDSGYNQIIAEPEQWMEQTKEKMSGVYQYRQLQFRETLQSNRGYHYQKEKRQW